MRTPRRYRLALLAYPAAYRADRGPELAATLAEGDEERGRPSLRESGALVVGGLAMRARMLERPDWLLAAGAFLALLALLGSFTWAERVFLFRGDAAAFATDGPGVWWSLALGVTAYVALVATVFGVLEHSRRRRLAVVLAAPLALAVFTGPGRVLSAGSPSAQTLLDYVVWSAEAIYANREITVPTTLAAVVGTWAALRVFAAMGSTARRRALSLCLALPAAIAIAQSWLRPDLQPDVERSFTNGYAQSAFADLGTATLLAALSLTLALVALWPARPKPRL